MENTEDFYDEEEEELYADQYSYCDLCGRDLTIEDHFLDCPNNDSPFARLLQDGYD